MAKARKYTEDQRDALCRLVNDQGISVPKALPILQQGDECEPMTISEDYARQIVREDRIAKGINIKDAPLTEAMDTLARQALELANRELARLHGTKTPLDADHFLKLARALRELQPLAQAQAPNKKTDTPRQPAWLTTLHVDSTDLPHSNKPSTTPTEPSLVRTFSA